MKNNRLAIVMMVLWASARPAVGQEVMYASTASGPVRGAVGTVDQTNGSFALLGDPTADTRDNLVGLSFDTAGRLFGDFVISDSDGSTLIEINPANGSLISTIGPIQDGMSNDIRIVDLATQPSTNTLFGIDSSGTLWTINKGTAVATLVGSTGFSRGGIAFGPDGTLYLATVNSQLVRLDPATGLPTGMPVSLQDCIDGLAVRPSDGALFGTECDGNDVDRINPVTGDTTALGPPSAFDTTDLAFRIAIAGLPAPVLSPVTLLVLAVCLAALGCLHSVNGRRAAGC